MSENSSLSKFLEQYGGTLTFAGVVVIMIGVLFLIAYILDSKRKEELGIAQQFSATLPTSIIGLGVGILIFHPFTSLLLSSLK